MREGVEGVREGVEGVGEGRSVGDEVREGEESGA